tara:strand:- start:181 stop:471 length:291 start_codon:yes stop_codon:yes gene_type:complete
LHIPTAVRIRDSLSPIGTSFDGPVSINFFNFNTSIVEESCCASCELCLGVFKHAVASVSGLIVAPAGTRDKRKHHEGSRYRQRRFEQSYIHEPLPA